MAITINSSPDIYSSLHAPLWFVLSSTNTAQTNFKYVCDVYVGGNLVARLKSFPQPVSSKGIFNVAPVVRNYWASYFKPDIITPSAFSYTGSDIYVDYELKFGEEYGGTTYLDLITTSKFGYNYIQDYLYTPTSPMYLTPLEYETQYQGNFISNRDYANIKFNKERLQTGYLFLSFLSDAENTPKNHSVDVSVWNGSTTTNYTGANVNFRDFACTQNDVVTLHYLNALGGYDTMDFTAVNRQTRNIEKSSFEGIEWEYSSNYMNRANTYGVMYGGSNQFATRQKLTYRLISDWLSYIDYLAIKELIGSSEIYLERGNNFIPVQVGTNTWAEKKRYADKTYNLELDISIANNINSQFR